MDREAWSAAIHGVATSRTWLSDWTELNWIVCQKVMNTVSVSHSVVPDSLPPHGLQPTRLLCPGGFPGKDAGVGCYFLLRGSSQPRDGTQFSCAAGRFFTHWATREALWMLWRKINASEWRCWKCKLKGWRECFIEKVIFEQGLQGEKGWAPRLWRGRAFQAEGIGAAWHVWAWAGRPGWRQGRSKWWAVDAGSRRPNWACRVFKARVSFLFLTI